MSIIEFENVHYTYPGDSRESLSGVTLSIEKGSFVFVIGGSGSGKSTLIKMLYREDKPTKGQVIVGGLDVAKLKDKSNRVVREPAEMLQLQDVFRNALMGAA